MRIFTTKKWVRGVPQGLILVHASLHTKLIVSEMWLLCLSFIVYAFCVKRDTAESILIVEMYYFLSNIFDKKTNDYLDIFYWWSFILNVLLLYLYIILHQYFKG